MSRKENPARADIYARITDRIAASLERGVRPSVKPWGTASMAGRITRPLRHNRQPYTGINVVLLWSEAVACGFRSAIWMTFKQASELGAHVRKGESGSVVVYASRFTKTETDNHGDEIERDRRQATTRVRCSISASGCRGSGSLIRPVAAPISLSSSTKRCGRSRPRLTSSAAKRIVP